MNGQLWGYKSQGQRNIMHDSITPDAQLWTNKLYYMLALDQESVANHSSPTKPKQTCRICPIHSAWCTDSCVCVCVCVRSRMCTLRGVGGWIGPCCTDHYFLSVSVSLWVSTSAGQEKSTAESFRQKDPPASRTHGHFGFSSVFPANSSQNVLVNVFQPLRMQQKKKSKYF